MDEKVKLALAAEQAIEDLSAATIGDLVKTYVQLLTEMKGA